jgi:hypothetical protein
VGVASLILVGTMLLTGCSASMMGDHLPTAVGGLPEGAPPRPATPAAYPAVHDEPPARSEAVLTREEQKKIEEELIAARNRANGGKPADGAKNP